MFTEGERDHSVDGETDGREEFVAVVVVTVEEEQFVLMVEGKRSSMGQVMKQCLLALKDMGTAMLVVRCTGLLLPEKDQLRWGVPDNEQDGGIFYTMGEEKNRKRDIDEGLFDSGRLHVYVIELWRHSEEGCGCWR
ncbi:hypothetical protein EV426DRAFT_707136 [Tirmania nivea]|nr:hypothetical protein EV426DRAFT_707136 [Tirmania nivea]